MTTSIRRIGRGACATLLVVTFLVVAFLVVAFLWAPGLSANADEEAANETGKTGGSAWSAPATPPTASKKPTTESHLPPPVVRVRRRGAQQAAPSPAAPRIRDVPSVSVRTPPSPPPPPPPGQPSVQPSGQPRTAVSAAPDGAVAIPGSGVRVVSLSKTHNVPRSDGSLALRLRVQYEVTNQMGKDVYVGAWFLRKQGGQSIRSNLREHADPQGFITAQSRPARVILSKGIYAAMLDVPYSAFPVEGAGDEYGVEVRVLVLRREPGSRMTVLARSETTFKVHAAPAEVPEPHVAPPPPMPSIAGETGMIEDFAPTRTRP